MKGNLKKVAITVGLSAVILLGASIPVVKMINNHKQQFYITYYFNRRYFILILK